jgi:hypothetical protein
MMGNRLFVAGGVGVVQPRCDVRTRADVHVLLLVEVMEAVGFHL